MFANEASMGVAVIVTTVALLWNIHWHEPGPWENFICFCVLAGVLLKGRIIWKEEMAEIGIGRLASESQHFRIAMIGSPSQIKGINDFNALH
jgi:hypothetical protein